MVGAYAGAFLMIISMVAIGYRSPQSSGQVASTASVADATAQSVEKASVDQLLASTIATNLAETVDLPVAGHMRESSTTLYIKSQLSQNDVEIISKPQIVQPTANGRDLLTYVTKEGDTASAIAAQYGISVDTLKWANDLTSDTLNANRELVVPQVDGVVYTAKNGDTVDSLAGHYKADKTRITLYNDLENTSLTEGMRIIIPGGVLPENERPGYRAPVQAAPVYQQSTSSTLRYGTAASYGSNKVIGYGTSMHSGNRYAFGNCTAYVYDKRYEAGRPIGGMWGNGSAWASSALNNGYVVNGTPAVGSILQSVSGGGGYGHVAYVEQVFGDGSVLISEMNYAGFNTVSQRTLSASEAAMFNYIH